MLLSPSFFLLPAFLFATLTSGYSHHRRHSLRSPPRSTRPLPARSSLFQPSSSKVALSRLSTRNERNSHLHPQVLLQMHINRSVRRHARMTKREVPTEAVLRKALVKRWEGVNQGVGDEVGNSRKEKRQREGKAMAGIGGLNSAASFKGKKGKGGAGGAGDGGNSTTTTGSGPGFSQKDFDASQSNSVEPAQTPTANSTIGLNIEANDVGYFATIQLGTPPANFKILMDSGSADGTGNVAGTIIQDDVLIAGLPIAGHSFGVTTSESSDFSDSSVPFDGLMGLAQSMLSEQGVLTPIESLAQTGAVPAQLGFHLARLSDGTNDGEVTFGGVDATKFNGSLTEFPNVNTQGFWEGAMGDVTVDGTALGLSGRTAILDTGTTLIVAPAADAAAVHAAIPGSASDGQGGFTIPCTSTASVALSFGGKSFAINASDLTFLPTTNNLQGDCVSGISSGSVGGANEWLVGDVFLKNVYFATSVESNTIGLAPSLEG
ncbi:hypothetical protein P7C70_g6278, partial [Phenoliferia sp. Uapishka_3]